MKHLLYQHKQNTTITTINYTHTTNKTNIYITTSNPNTTNLITKLTNTLLNSIPIITITNQISTPFINTNTFQKINILKLSLTYTKHNFLIQSLKKLPHIITKTFNITYSNHPDPILINIPKNIQLTNNNLKP